MNWLYDHIRIRSLFILVAALGALSMMVDAHAAQPLSYTIAKPAGYVDGTPFATEQLAYVLYNAANDAQLFSTLTLTGTASVPDGVTCIYARAAVFNVTANTVIAATLSDPTKPSCKPAPPPPTKKVAVPSLTLKW